MWMKTDSKMLGHKDIQQTSGLRPYLESEHPLMMATF